MYNVRIKEKRKGAFILLTSFLRILLFTTLLQAADNPIKDGTLKLFKIGFEFQEAHNLCPWAPQHREVQNKHIFCVKNTKGRILWNLTIDWKDLEFVTEPFSSNEKEELYLAIETIEEACHSLSRLAKKYDKCDHTITFETWMQDLEKSLNNDRSSFERLETSELVVRSSIQLKHDFSTKFQPQITIQHHLEDTINLTMGLFSDNLDFGNQVFLTNSKLQSSGAATAVEVIENCFLPIKTVAEEQEESNWDGVTPTYYESDKSFYFPNKTSKKDGFLFLHMMTCCDLARSSKPPQDGVKNIHKDIFGKTGQINPKSYVHLVSRRPFSSMLREIAEGELYAEFVRQRVKQSFLDSLEDKFKRLNYGEIYESDLAQNAYFSSLLSSRECCQLLGAGVVSTSMLLSISEPEKIDQIQKIFDRYFNDVLASMNRPYSIRYFFDPGESRVIGEFTPHDLLSPPHFVSDQDSMGAFKDDRHDRDYGEAIVEFRDISRISQRALDKIAGKIRHLNCISPGAFLCTNNDSGINKYSLQNQIKGLISYIEDLLIGGNDENQTA